MQRHTPAWAVGHDVQFYESEMFLVDRVAEFLAEGIRAGQPLVVIATDLHRRGFAARLRAEGIDIEDKTRADIIWLDARETLDSFMEGGRPDPELFEMTIGNVLTRLIAARSYLVVRAYGEMVDLLWREGNTDGALALEALWNAIARKYSFNLLCGYAMEAVFKRSSSHGLNDICAHHHRVMHQNGSPATPA
jgi:hypothetical protein